MLFVQDGRLACGTLYVQPLNGLRGLQDGKYCNKPPYISLSAHEHLCGIPLSGCQCVVGFWGLA